MNSSKLLKRLKKKEWLQRLLRLKRVIFSIFIFITSIILLSIFPLIGCNHDKVPNYLDFTIVSMNLSSNPELEELIVLEADVRESELRLTLYNNSDESFMFTGFHGNIHTRIRFFDGENWRIVPHHPDVVELWQEDSAEHLYPHTRWRWTVDLTDYYLPENGLFRYVLGITVGHTVFIDFSIE